MSDLAEEIIRSCLYCLFEKRLRRGIGRSYDTQFALIAASNVIKQSRP